MRMFLTVALLALLVTPALADHHEGAPDPAAMGEMGRPAEMDRIAWMQGDWDVAMKFKMDPSAPEWVETTASATVTTMLDGCVQRMDFQAEIMGATYHGLGLTTYNREYDRYETVWVDDMAGKMSMMHGNFQDGQLVMTGDDKMQGMEYMNRSTEKKVSEDEAFWTMEMSMDGGKTWVDNMQMTYTRKQ